MVIQTKEQSKYVLLRGHKFNNIFWTTNNGSEQEGFDILYYGNDTKEMAKVWTQFQYSRVQRVNLEDFFN